MKYAYAIAAAVPVVLAELHDVTVGDDRQLQFDPQVVTAAVGDQVRFTFYPDHDVAQGAFSSPCTPSDGGFYSGRLNFTDNTNLDAEATQQFTIDVTNTDPIWYYCTTAQHCQSGMVGGINIPSDGDNTIDAYSSAAATAPRNVRPEGAMVAGGMLSDNDEADNPSVTPSPSAIPSPSEMPTPAASGSGTPSGTEAAPSATSNAATAANGQVGTSTFLALFAGVVAWFL